MKFEQIIDHLITKKDIIFFFPFNQSDGIVIFCVHLHRYLLELFSQVSYVGLRVRGPSDLLFYFDGEGELGLQYCQRMNKSELMRWHVLSEF